MEMIEELVLGFFNKQVLIYIVPIGYLIFLSYFYGSKKWEKFTDLDKICFTILTAFVMVYFVAYPIALFSTIIQNLFSFNGETNIINPNPNQIIQTYSLFLLIIGSIIIGKRIISKNPLCENEKMNQFNIKITLLIIFALLILLFLFSISFYFSGYSHYFKYLYFHIFTSVISFSGLILTFIVINKSSSLDLYNNMNNYVENKLNSNRFKLILIVVIIISFISSAFVGMFIFKPSIIENGQQTKEINIDYLPVSEPSRNVNAENIVDKYYIVKTKLIPWVKIDTNLTLKSARGEVDGYYTEYDVDSSNFTAVNCSKKTNITVRGTEKFYITNELTFEINRPAFKNNTEIINLTLKNNVPAIIEIRDTEILINKNYYLSEDNFIKTQHFANGNGGISGYTQENNKLYLTNIHLYKNATGTITLILKKIET